MSSNYFVHPTAIIEENVLLGEGTKIWHHAQIRNGAHLGRNCIIGKGVFIDTKVKIGDNVKIQNYVSIYHGVTIEDEVFIGPHAVFTNDLRPRALGDWKITETLVKKGVSIGANSTIKCGIILEKYSMIGAGTVLVKSTRPYELVFGNPGKPRGFVCRCGEKLLGDPYVNSQTCQECGTTIDCSKI
ncbi:MAG: acyltransferase [Candidatus Thorarchaeota archaeon]